MPSAAAARTSSHIYSSRAEREPQSLTYMPQVLVKPVRNATSSSILVFRNLRVSKAGSPWCWFIARTLKSWGCRVVGRCRHQAGDHKSAVVASHVAVLLQPKVEVMRDNPATSAPVRRCEHGRPSSQQEPCSGVISGTMQKVSCEWCCFGSARRRFCPRKARLVGYQRSLIVLHFIANRSIISMTSFLYKCNCCASTCTDSMLRTAVSGTLIQMCCCCL